MLVATSPYVVGQSSTRKPAGSTLRIVQDAFVVNGYFYDVKGSVYNPNNDAVKNVVIKYYIWKKLMGKDGHGPVPKETGGLVSATIKYLPPKQILGFTATSQNAAVMTPESGSPDPINAEISADWDDQP
jgi:hypothetical protein